MKPIKNYLARIISTHLQLSPLSFKVWEKNFSRYLITVVSFAQ